MVALCLMSADRTERLLNLLTLLLNARKPLPLAEIRELDEFSAYNTDDPKSGERGFERDKAALLEMGVPLLWVGPEQDEWGDEGGGYQIDGDLYYLPEIKYSPSELALLSIVGSAAATVQGLPGRSALVRALAKMGFGVEATSLPPLLSHAPSHFVGERKGNKDLEMVRDALEHQRSIRLVYQARGPESEPTHRRVEPRGLYYRHGLWYLVAFCHLREEVRTFHLGRIVELSFAAKKQVSDYEIPDDFEISSYASRMPWELGAEQPFETRCRISQKLVPAIKEIFGPRASREDVADTVFVNLQISNKNEFVAAILPFGADIEVLEPSELREELGEVFATLAARYKPMSEIGGES